MISAPKKASFLSASVFCTFLFAGLPCIARHDSCDEFLVLPTDLATNGQKVRFLTIKNDVSLRVFDRPVLYPALEMVQFVGCSVDQFELLKTLADNYKRLPILGIGQDTPLDVQSIQLLPRFKSLKLLQIAFPSPEVEILCLSIPKNAASLALLPPSSLASQERFGLDLPSLQGLMIRDSSCSCRFIELSKLPNLRAVSLICDKLESRTIRAFSRFPKLKTLDIYGTVVLAEDIEFLKSHNIDVNFNNLSPEEIIRESCSSSGGAGLEPF